MVRKRYRIIGLPEDLYFQCEEIVKSGRHGYVSVSELVKDGVRRRLEELKKLEQSAVQTSPQALREAAGPKSALCRPS